MKHLESQPVRNVIAVAIGIPGTVVLGASAILVAGSGLVAIPFALAEVIQGHRRISYIANTLLIFAWGSAGVAGLVAFWAWVISNRPLSPRRRLLIGLGLAGGIAAASPFVVMVPEGWFSWLATVGCVTAALIIADLCLLTTRWSGP